MANYYHSYVHVIKNNVFVFMMSCMLLIVTLFIWVGIPIFYIGPLFVSVFANIVLTKLVIALSVGFLFSLYFIPINVKVSRRVAGKNKTPVIYSFLKLELVWVISGAIVFLLCLKMFD